MNIEWRGVEALSKKLLEKVKLILQKLAERTSVIFIQGHRKMLIAVGMYPLKVVHR